MRNRKKKSCAEAFLLITTFSLLQLALWLPPFLHAFHENGAAVTCQQDHSLCLCSPGRIASGTCCCSLATISPCCQKEYIQSAVTEKAALGAVITSLPCSGGEDSMASVSSESYLLPTIRTFSCPLSTTVYSLNSAASQIDHHISPPIPPPEV